MSAREHWENRKENRPKQIWFSPACFEKEADRIPAQSKGEKGAIPVKTYLD